MKNLILLFTFCIIISAHTNYVKSQTINKYGVEINFTEYQEEVLINLTNQNPYTVYCQLLINKEVYWVNWMPSEMTHYLEFNNNVNIRKCTFIFWRCWGAGFYQFKYLGTFTYNIH